MQSSAKTADNYIAELPPERKEIISKLRNIIREHLPDGFEETMQYGMITYVVPHSLYPAGYHCKPKDALPFISLASQKNHIALYHMGMYGSSTLLNWYLDEYSKI